MTYSLRANTSSGAGDIRSVQNRCTRVAALDENSGAPPGRRHRHARNAVIHTGSDARPSLKIAACCLRTKYLHADGACSTFHDLRGVVESSDVNVINRNNREGPREMADESNNQGDIMDERSGAGNAGRTGTDNGIGRSGGTDFSGRSSGSGTGREGNIGEVSGAESRVSRKTPRGFAAMDPQAQRAIAAKGGRAAHQKGTAHEFTSEEARIAGRKGGEASRGGRRGSSGGGSNT